MWRNIAALIFFMLFMVSFEILLSVDMDWVAAKIPTDTAIVPETWNNGRCRRLNMEGGEFSKTSWLGDTRLGRIEYGDEVHRTDPEQRQTSQTADQKSPRGVGFGL